MAYARWWAATAVLFVCCGSGLLAQYARRTPIVEAVRKTKDAIVTVHGERAGSLGPRETIGTGVVVDERGIVVSNCHLVQQAQRVRVELADGTTTDAETIAEDPAADLAFLRLAVGKRLAFLSIAPSSDLMVGETVIAIGHPFGYANTVSTGIVSALGREVGMPSGQVLHGLIQTDAGINPGSSGGPLLNINGELIGLNVAFREGAQGIAFAINADTLKESLARNLSSERMAGVSHGLTCTERVEGDGPNRQTVVLTGDCARSAGLAGLQPGDEIHSIGGRRVVNRFDLERAVWNYHPGDQVPVTILRAGIERLVSLRLNGAAAHEPMRLAAPSSRNPALGIAAAAQAIGDAR